MIYILGSFVFAVIGILLKGMLHLTFAEVVVVLSIPMMFIYKLLGNRPSFFVYIAMLAGLAGGVSAFHGYVVIPIQYYHEIWGWAGIVGGVIAVLLTPLELFAFLAVAYFKGGAAIYMGDFFAGILFGLTGYLLYLSPHTDSIWTRFLHREHRE